MYLVWVRSPKGPTPEKWPELLKYVTGKVMVNLAYYKVKPEHEKLSLDKLAQLYPLK